MIGLIFLLIFLLISIVLFFLFLSIEISYRKFLYKRGDGDLRIKYPYEYKDISREKISFKNKDSAALSGYIYKDENNKNPKALIVIVHGIGYGHFYLLPLIRKLVHDGYLVLAYDQYGSGISEGTYVSSALRGILDLECALEYISTNETINKLDLYLLGHSWGGFTVINALNIKDNDIKKIISISGFNNENDLIKPSSKIVKYLSWAIYIRNFCRYGRASFFSSYKSLLNNKSAKVMYLQGEDDNIVSPNLSGYKFKEIEEKNNLLKVIMFKDKGHAPQVTKKAQEEQDKVLKELGLFGGDLTNYNKQIDYEELSTIDEDVYQLILDFYNN